MPAYEPDDLIGLIGYLVFGVPAILAAWAGWVAARRAGAARGEAAAARYQVQNSHEENLRDQLDRMQHAQITMQRTVDRIESDTGDRLDQMHRDIRGMRQEVGGIHGGMRDERAARVDLERRVDRIERDSRGR